MSFGVGLWMIWFCVVGIVQVVRVDRRRRQLNRAERIVRQTRADATDGTTTYRAVRDDEAHLLATYRGGELDLRSVETCGFRLLGTFVMLRSDDGVIAVSRAYVDEAETTIAYLVGLPARPGKLTLIYESYTDDHTWATIRRDDRGTLAPSPLADRNFVTTKLAPADALASHRAFASPPDVARTFLRIATPDELVAINVRNHQAYARWRRTQSPDALLKADLENLLGRRYARYGKLFLRRLTEELPRATARRA